MSKFIIAYTPVFKKSLLNEISLVDKNIVFIEDIDASTFIFESSISKEGFIDKIINKQPIFIKHLMPIDKEFKISLKKDKDLETLKYETENIFPINKGEKFSVQCRIKNSKNEGIDYSSKDVEVALGMKYEDLGGIPVFSDDNLKNENIKILSVLINRDSAYLGCSSSVENLNFHCDEHRICSKTGREISRAENKLKEALTKFDIKLSKEGYALDIGAAPGGWTKVLADHGYNVIAVDPGNLKKELLENPKIKHYKCRIEDLEFDNYFDIIVNDMNVDPDITANIMNDLAKTLKDNSLAIVTLKLPGKVEETIQEAKEILEENYEVIAIKSLFHNRQEVTALLKKRKRK